MIKNFNDFITEGFTASAQKKLAMTMKFLEIGGGLLLFIGDDDDTIAKFVASLDDGFESNFTDGIFSVGIDLSDSGFQDLKSTEMDKLQRGRAHKSCVVLNTKECPDDFQTELFKKATMKVYIKDIEMED